MESRAPQVLEGHRENEAPPVSLAQMGDPALQAYLVLQELEDPLDWKVCLVLLDPQEYLVWKPLCYVY